MPVSTLTFKKKIHAKLSDIITYNDWCESIDNNPDNTIHQNQKEAAKKMVQMALKENKIRINLLASPQSGKTGTAKAFIAPLIKKGIKIAVISGMSILTMKEQLKKDLDIDEVYHNPDLQQILKENKNKFDGYIILIDESHYGQNIDGVVDKLMADIGANSNGEKNNESIHLIISISATPMSEIHPTNKSKTKGIVTLEPGIGYKSMKMMLQNNKIKNPHNLRNIKDCKKFINEQHKEKRLKYH